MKTAASLFFITTLLWLSLLWVGCERSRILILPERESQLVLNGINELGNSWTFTLENTLENGVPFGDKLPSGEVWLKNSAGDTVLFSQDSVFVNRFSDTSSSPQIGQAYQVFAYHPGFDSVHASFRVPLPMPKISSSFQLSQNERPSPETPIILELSDPEVGKRNYFMVYSYLEDTVFDDIKGAATLSNDPIFNFSTVLKLPVSGETVLFRPTFFTDDLFTNGKYGVELRFGLPDFEFAEGRRLVFLVATISQLMYEYLESYQKQGSVGESPFAEPAPVFGNVVNGEGLVAVYSAVADSLVIW